MGFKDFCNNKDKNLNDEEVLKANAKNVEELYNEYKDKNEDELLQELFKSVEKQKTNGTFDYNSLLKMIEMLKPYLNQEQIIKMKEILTKIQ
ncbi:MAG: hypothetical protein E7376_01160 [Clostridiales bacterium]|nr:hypothetical protein [Clostridiales bacterium]